MSKWKSSSYDSPFPEPHGTNKRASEAEIRSLFEALDKDSNGYVDRNELRDTMEEVGLVLADGDVNNMMVAANLPLKDRIFYEDFVKMMAGRVGHSQRRALYKKREAQGPSTYSICEGEEENKDMQAMRVAFSMFDKNKDGLISVQEVFDTMTLSLGMKVTLKDVKQIVIKVDLDGDGYINFEEFCHAIHRQKHNTTSKNHALPTLSTKRLKPRDFKSSTLDHIPRQELAQAFRVFDKDMDGYINADDLKSTMQQLGLSLTEDDLQAMMKSARIGTGEKISFSEFCRIYTSQTSLNSDHGSTSGRKGGESKKTYSNKLTKPQETEEIKAVFDIFDVDKDGYITKNEVIQVLASMDIHPSNQCMAGVFEEVDIDCNGKIDFDEFMLLIHKYENPFNEEAEIKEMFRSMDKDSSGFIDTIELKTSFGALGVPLSDEDVKAMMEEAGIKGQKIFFKDFLRIMSGKFGVSVSNNNSFDSEYSLPFDLAYITSQKNKTLTRQHAHVDRKMDNVLESEKGEREEEIEEEEEEEDDGIEDEEDDITYLYGKPSNEKKNISKAIKENVKWENNPHYYPPKITSTRSNPQKNDNQDNIKEGSVFDGSKNLKERRASLLDKTNTTSLEVQEFFKESLSSEFTPSSLSHVFKGNISHSNNKETNISDKNIHQNIKTNSNTISGFPSHNSTLIKSCDQNAPKKNCNESVPQKTSNISVTIKSSTFQTDIIPQLYSQSQAQQVQTKPNQQQQQKCIHGQQQNPPKHIQDKNCQQFPIQQFIQQNQHIQPLQQPLRRKTSNIEKNSPPSTWIAFKIFDRNADGYITKSELYSTMVELGIPLSKKDIESMMMEADINKDGKIDYAEFSKLMLGTFEVYATEAAKQTEKRKRSSSMGRVLQTQPSNSFLEPKHTTNRRTHHSSSPSYYNNNNGSTIASPASFISSTSSNHQSNSKEAYQRSQQQKPSTMNFSTSPPQQIFSQQFHQQQKIQANNIYQQPKHKQQFLVDQCEFRSPLKQPVDHQQLIQFSSFQTTLQKNNSQNSRQCIPAFQQFDQPPQKQMHIHTINNRQPNSFPRPTLDIPPRPQPTLFQEKSNIQTDFETQNQFLKNCKTQTQYCTSSSQCNPQKTFSNNSTFDNNPVNVSTRTMNSLTQPNNSNKSSSNPFNPVFSDNHPTTNNISHGHIVRTNSVEDEMRIAFKFFDIDGNGLIDALELKQTMQSLDEMISDQDVEAMILAVDKNGDGKVDYEEFIQLLKFTQMVDTG